MTDNKRRIQAEVGLPETRKGLIIVDTGPGKGKTAAALGTRVRRVGQGLKVLMVQLERDRGPKRNRVLKFSHWAIESFSHFYVGRLLRFFNDSMTQ